MMLWILSTRGKHFYRKRCESCGAAKGNGKGGAGVAHANYADVEVFVGSDRVLCYTTDGSKPVYKAGKCGKNTMMEWPYYNMVNIRVAPKTKR